MKTLLALAVMTGFAGSAFADIQDPPSNDYGPTRKLGRGLSNFFIAPAEDADPPSSLESDPADDEALLVLSQSARNFAKP